MELITFALRHDWPFLLPIFVCSVLALAVALERWWYYTRNRRDVVELIAEIKERLHRGSIERAIAAAQNCDGLLGEVAESGLDTLAEHESGFERQFDITVSLATRKLERNLSILGSIATISPYLGLFGTVVRILLTFGEMAKEGDAASAATIMFGIGSALIATAFGLGLAITAVALNNYFQSVVSRWEEDFQLLKLLLLSYAEKRGAVEPDRPRPRPSVQI